MKVNAFSTVYYLDIRQMWLDTICLEIIFVYF